MQTPSLEPKSKHPQKQQVSFVPSYAPTGKVMLHLLLAQILACLVFRFELFSTFTTDLIGGFSGDGGLYYWLVQHNAHSLFSIPWFNTHAFYPYTESLAWSDNFIFPSLFFSVFQKFGLSPISAYNLVIVGTLLLGGLAMSRFCYLLTGNTFAACFAGILFMNSSYMSSVIGHPQLQFTFFFPLAAEQLFLFLKSRTVKSALLIGALITLAFLTTVYYAVFLVFLIGVLAIAVFLLRPQEFSISDAKALLTGLVFGCLPLLFFVSPYLDVRDTFGKKFLYEPYFFSTSILSLFSAPDSSILFSWTKNWAHDEAHFFIGTLPFLLLTPLLFRLYEAKPLRRLGYTILALFLAAGSLAVLTRLRWAEWGAIVLSYLIVISSLIYLFRLGRLERALGASYLTFRALSALFLGLFFVVFVISLGPLGNSAQGDSALGVYRILYEVFPGFNSIRAISRILILATFALSVLSALSIKFIIGKYKPQLFWYALISLFVVLENLSYPLIKEPVNTTPLVFEMLGNYAQANDAAIILPFSGALKETGEFQSWKEFAKIQVSAMNWAQGKNIHIVNGYSGQQTKLMKELPRELAEFPDQRSLQTLRSFAGLRYIIYTPQFKPQFSRDEFDIRLRYVKDELKLLQVDTQGNYLFELTGESPLGPDFQLLVPSFPPRSISFQIKGVGTADILDVYLAHHQENTPFASIKIEPDTNLRWYTLELPLLSDTVRPVRLSFRSRNNTALILGQSRLKTVE